VCGRYSFFLRPEEVRDLAGSAPEPFPEPVYNQPPGVPVTLLDGGEGWRRLPWGTEVPVGEGQRRLVINARSETAGTKRTFRDGFGRRRCVLPASGFFEWRRGSGPSRPFFFRPRSGPGILLAGLLVGSGEGAAVVVLTREGDDWMKEVHHRAPVLVRPDRLGDWLDPDREGADALREASFGTESGVLDRHPVSPRVNKVRENDPDLLAPV
jgi:putative SOS response-associated peptidase YedK